MIPVKLKVRNFMPYRDNVPPLDFEGIHTACICGNNGSGKSALIDAITWALWGEARARSDDDLIHENQPEAEVEFDFAVGPQLYKVIRKRSRPRRSGVGHTILELQIASDGGFKSISGDSVGQTQEKIIRNVLHMDYKTFINSAFLKQGHADEFTVKPPGERKQVLADILGLSFYDELEEKAKELARERGTVRAQLETTLKDIAEELTHKPEYEAALSQAQAELSTIEPALKEQESRLNELRQKRELLENRKAQLVQIEGHINENKKALERWASQLQQHQTRIKEYEELISHRSAIEEGYAHFNQAKLLQEDFDRRFRQSYTIEKQKTQLENRIKEAERNLVTEHALIESKISEYEADLAKIPQLKAELQTVQTGLKEIADREQSLKQRQETNLELRAKIRRLDDDCERLAREIKETQEKLNILSSQTEAKCPLCERELAPDGLKLITAKYNAEKQLKTDSLKETQLKTASHKREAESLETDVARFETRLKQERVILQNKSGMLEKSIADAEEAKNKLSDSKTKLGIIEQHLTSRDFAVAEQKALVEFGDELLKLGYDSLKHEEVRQRLTDFRQYEEPKRKLDEAERHIASEKQSASAAGEAINDLHISLTAQDTQRNALNSDISGLPALLIEVNQAETDFRELTARQRQAQSKVWQATTQLQRCTELEARKVEREQTLSLIAGEEAVYRELAQAFGKKGVQALLIENALPEIEEEADKLLAKMTDNRMHLTIETQRQTKKGDMIETLDINVSDDLGTRNYEMFSGGEAFRINFAIRIALSKLLAKRAGAPLPTLIIDEGFGTQDASGIEKIKEAINSIQDDFEKILVITHIDEIKDTFPVRIDVTKTQEGSTITVS